MRRRRRRRRRRKNIKSPFNVPEDSFFVRLWLLHPLLGRNEGRFNCRQMKEMFVLRFTSDTTPPTLLHLVVGGSVAQTHRRGGRHSIRRCCSRPEEEARVLRRLGDSVTGGDEGKVDPRTV